jgi:hypothetical protein
MSNAREAVQHMDDIEIPSIEITAGWAANSVKTMQDCDDAFAYLMSASAQIEFQIDTELSKPKSAQDWTWLAKARCALKYKKAALQIVNQKRGYIGEAEKRIWQDSRDRRLLEHIRAKVSDTTFMGWVRDSKVNESEQVAA